MDSEVSWRVVGITYSMVKHRPLSSPGTKHREGNIHPEPSTQLINLLFGDTESQTQKHTAVIRWSTDTSLGFLYDDNIYHGNKLWPCIIYFPVRFIISCAGMSKLVRLPCSNFTLFPLGQNETLNNSQHFAIKHGINSWFHSIHHFSVFIC